MLSIIRHTNDISIHDIYDRHMLASPTCQQTKLYTDVIRQYSARRTK